MKKKTISRLKFGKLLFVAAALSWCGVAASQQIMEAAGGNPSPTSTPSAPKYSISAEDLNGTSDDSEAQSEMLNLFRGIIPNTILDPMINSVTGGKKPAVTSSVAPQQGTSAVKAQELTKNLKLGVKDPEVKRLQQILNEDKDTEVAISGPGSKGQETDYFGGKTKTAVIKLQEKHRGEVLTPNGLTSGTGFVGASTRALVNHMQENKVSSSAAIGTIPKTAVVSGSKAAKIDKLVPSSGKPGTKISINGSGFAKLSNKVYVGGKAFTGSVSSDGSTLTVEIAPAGELFAITSNLSTASTTYILEHFSEYKTPDFPRLQVPVCVETDTGMSNCEFFEVTI